jgi:Domain of unknown function (DUF4872)/Butirosin biosynthesis protein H, N-terminal
MPIQFDHVHAAHCESGAFTALLRHHGLTLTESMVFGIGSGLFFLFFPHLKMYGAPLVAYRDAPNFIISRCTRRLGVKIRKARFSNQDEGMRELDAMLARDIPVGMQTGAFWLPYFPRSMRFQFNGHHIIAYGRDRDDYLISDTVFEDVVRCPSDDLRRARFSKGPLAPKGFLYHLESVNTDPDLASAVREGIRSTVNRMLRIPLPYMGVWGIRTLAKAMRAWPERNGMLKAHSWLANVIRMQEEIGTGGAGFRFMYAAFLDEAAGVLNRPALRELSEQLTETGDQWREFSVRGARVIRNKDDSAGVFVELAAMLQDCAVREHRIFTDLRRVIA